MSLMLVLLHALLRKRIKQLVSVIHVLLYFANFVSGILIFVEVNHQTKSENLYLEAELFWSSIRFRHGYCILENSDNGKDIGGFLHHLFKEPRNSLFWAIIAFPVTMRMLKVLTSLNRQNKFSIAFIVKLIRQAVEIMKNLNIGIRLYKALMVLVKICSQPEKIFRKHRQTWRLKKSARKFLRRTLKRHDKTFSEGWRLRTNKQMLSSMAGTQSNKRGFDGSETDRSFTNNDFRDNNIKSKKVDIPPKHDVVNDESTVSADKNSVAQNLNGNPPNTSKIDSSPEKNTNAQDVFKEIEETGTVAHAEETTTPTVDSATLDETNQNQEICKKADGIAFSGTDSDLLADSIGSRSSSFDNLANEGQSESVHLPRISDPTPFHKNSGRSSRYESIRSQEKEENVSTEINSFTIDYKKQPCQVSRNFAAGVFVESSDMESAMTKLEINEHVVSDSGDSVNFNIRKYGTIQHFSKLTESDNNELKMCLVEKRGQSINGVQETDPGVEMSSIPEYMTRSKTSKDEINADSDLPKNGYKTDYCLGEKNNSTIREEKHEVASSLFSRSVRYVDSETKSTNEERIICLPANVTNNNNVKKYETEAHDKFSTAVCIHEEIVKTNGNLVSSGQDKEEVENEFKSEKDLEYLKSLSKMSQKEKEEYIFRREVDSYENLRILEEKRREISENIVLLRKYQCKSKNPFRWIRNAIQGKFRSGLKKKKTGSIYKLELLLTKIEIDIQIEPKQNKELRRSLLLFEEKKTMRDSNCS
ncbi:uncharacterized protein LOC120347677 [Styela clava]